MGQVLKCFLFLLFGFLNIGKSSKVADYSTILNSSPFMDRTMMVNAFLEDINKRILVAAPRGSGRTMNLQMLKQFLEISVDLNGNPESRNETDNFKLFSDNHLNIFQHKGIVEKHFGKYPVLFLNCRTLGNAVTFRELTCEFREIVRELFVSHKYLLLHKHLWLDTFEVDMFKNFITGKGTDRLNPNYMIKGLSYLAELLHQHFRKPVIVLIDDYDAVAPTLHTEYASEDSEKSTYFLKTLYHTLLERCKFVDRALLTGVFRAGGSVAPEFSYTVLPAGTVSYDYTDKRTLCKYFKHKFK